MNIFEFENIFRFLTTFSTLNFIFLSFTTLKIFCTFPHSANDNFCLFVYDCLHNNKSLILKHLDLLFYFYILHLDVMFQVRQQEQNPQQFFLSFLLTDMLNIHH